MLFWVILLVIAVFTFFYMGAGTPRHKVDSMIKKCASFALQAQQDQSPVQALLHANYASAYLDALKTVSSERQIQQVGAIKLGQFEEHILNVQKSVTDKILTKVPEFAGDVDLYLQTIANPNVNWASRGVEAPPSTV